MTTFTYHIHSCPHPLLPHAASALPTLVCSVVSFREICNKIKRLYICYHHFYNSLETKNGGIELKGEGQAYELACVMNSETIVRMCFDLTTVSPPPSHTEKQVTFKHKCFKLIDKKHPQYTVISCHLIAKWF